MTNESRPFHQTAYDLQPLSLYVALCFYPLQDAESLKKQRIGKNWTGSCIYSQMKTQDN